MARPQKEGMDYFPLDIDMDQDDKIRLVEAKFKLAGFAILIKLLMKIYKEGYFYRWTEREQLLFADKVKEDVSLVNDVVNEALKWEFFNLELYKQYQILTSRGIQKRFVEAAKRRKEVTVIEEFLLINMDTFPENVAITVVNVTKTPVNVTETNSESELMSTLIPKEKKRKVKESKVNTSTNAQPEEQQLRAMTQAEIFERFWNAYPKKRSRGQAEKAFAKLKVDEQFLAIMIAKIEQAKKSTDWQKENGQYIPYPSTWLNAKGWKDEIPEAKGGAKPNAVSQRDPGDDPWESDPYMRQLRKDDG